MKQPEIDHLFEKWWRNHTIDFGRPFTSSEKQLARAAFEAAIRLSGSADDNGRTGLSPIT